MQILNARTTMECSIAAEAALTGSHESFLELELTLTRMKNNPSTMDYARWDRAFHTGIAAATGQPLLSSLICNLMQRQNHVYLPKGKSRNLSDEVADHELILEAIRQRNPLRASREMRRHLNHVREFLLGYTDGEIELAVQ